MLMASLNRVTLMGNLTRDPELRYTPNGTPVTDIGMALNAKKKGGEDEVTFVEVTCWGKTAEIVNDMRKARHQPPL